MKLPPGEPRDRRPHTYCPNCFKPGTLKRRYLKRAADYFVCSNCGRRTYRTIFIGPKVSWWLDDNREIWHETVAVIVANDAGKILFFQRRLYPPKISVPAGHVEIAFTIGQNAAMELEEETGLKPGRLTHLATLEIPGDKCMSGADFHRWHVYRAHVTGEPSVRINHEGGHPMWATKTEALKLDLAPAIRYMLEHVEF